MSKPNMSRYKFTPASTANMSESQLRHAYSYLRDIVNKRASRISDKGFGNWEYGKKIPKLKDVPSGRLREAVLDASRRARDIESFSGGFEERLDDRIRMLQEAGYSGIDRSNVQQFFDFMNRREDAFRRGLFDSNIVARVFSMAASKGVSAKTIQREFGDYMSSNSRMEQLYDAIEAFDLPEGRKRMSSTEIRERLI